MIFRHLVFQLVKLQTATSKFLAFPVEWEELLGTCANEVSANLLCNPPIVVYGKQCVQHRDIGFFSNE